jgi:hypothetical protein
MAEDRIEHALWRIASTNDRPYGSSPHDRDEPGGAGRRRPRRQPPRPAALAPEGDDTDPPLVGRRIDVRV